MFGACRHCINSRERLARVFHASLLPLRACIMGETPLILPALCYACGRWRAQGQICPEKLGGFVGTLSVFGAPSEGVEEGEYLTPTCTVICVGVKSRVRFIFCAFYIACVFYCVRFLSCAFQSMFHTQESNYFCGVIYPPILFILYLYITRGIWRWSKLPNCISLQILI